ncbi:uncharacterized protein HMF8227_00292 [Saliniradius amylolyticus]|uniref:YhdP central domain-containing protein n=1 Tax=Saliniradius amylolyticus TaxID=2183582 RepID=A0A2S2E0I6_9ALTE|nr:YhdP family protein [Saliniradius amylolyticus]AWL10800.1 uncharacterized protein HMF8227_00292 [Saliniradius amylolyticus]
MRSPRFYLSWGLRKLWELSAVLLVTLAVLLSALRLALPHLDSNKQLLEDYISDTYGAELSIGAISASWTGTGPAMVLKDVRLNSEQDAPIRLTIEETQVELDFWASVLNGNIQSKRFHLSELALLLDVDRLEAGEDDNYPVVDALQSLFLEQLQRFSVTDSRLLLTNRGKQQVVNLQKLSWLNQGQRHQGVGLMRVSDLTRNSASFILDLTGDSSALSGTFYANASELDISPWLTQWNPSSRNLTDARVNVTLWADIEPEGISETQAVFGTSMLNWEDGRNIEVSGGRLDAVPDGDGWRFEISELVLDGHGFTKPVPMSLNGQWSGGGRLQLQSSQLELTGVIDTLSVFRPQLAELAPKGQLSLLQFSSDGENHLLRADIEGLELPESTDYPGIGPLSAQLDWHNHSGLVTLSGGASVLNGQQLLGFDLEYQSLHARAYLDTSSGFSMYIPRLSLASELVTLEHSLYYRGDDRHLALVANIQDMDIATAKRLFPGNLMGQKTSQYLTRALIDGEVSQAQVIWQGPLSGFPFDEQEGVFQAGLAVDNAEFKFAPDWPAVTGLDADVLFENKAMTVTGRQGRIASIQATRLNGEIADLTENAELSLDLAAKASGEAIGELMDSSSLRNSVGVALQELRIDGTLSANVAINVPLTTDNVVAEGVVSFDNNQVFIRSLEQSFTELNGQLRFTNEVITADNLNAKLWQQPMTLSLDGQQLDAGYQTQIQLEGNWDLSQLLQPVAEDFSRRFEGKTQWQGQVSLLLPEQGYQYEASVEADLLGMEVGLPAPFAKQSGQAGQLTAKVSGDALVSEVNMNLNDEVTFNGLLPHKEMRFSRAHLAMGKTDFVGMGSGFSISANLPRVNLLAWQQAVADLIGDQDSQPNSRLLAQPERIFLFAERLDMAGLVLNNADVNVKYSDLAWLADVSAKQSRAQVRLFHDWQQQGVEIEADYLRIPRLAEGGWRDALGAEQTELPPIRFRCGNCQYQDWELGRVELTLTPNAAGVGIEELSISRNGSTLDASGQWLTAEDTASTQLNGRLTSDDIGRLLKDLNVHSGIRDSGADIRFDLNWQQAPHQFNVASLGGEVQWRLSDGYLAEVSDKGARLFSILSLDSLVRKLTLDFRDVFAKGFFYDEMEGSFQIEQGQVNTDDTVIDGAAGKMQLAGFTNLNTEELNYDIEFTPKITSSLPVILAWMANPATAIAAFAIDEVLTSAKVISNIKYSLTGSLDDPILKEMKRDSREVEIPAQNRPKSPPTQNPETNDQEAENG